MAEALLGARIAERELPAAVGSAGLLEGGRERPPEVTAVLAKRGVALPDQLSRQLLQGDLQRADLVLGMERGARSPRGASRARSLASDVHLERAGPSRSRTRLKATGRVARRVAGESHEGRDRPDMLGDSLLDDVADPYGGPSSAYEAAVIEIEDLVDRLVSLLWPISGAPHRPPGTSGAQASW